MTMPCTRVCLALGALASCHRGEPPVKRSPVEMAPMVPPKTEPSMPTPESAPEMRRSKAFPACPGGGFSFELKGLPRERVSERFGPPAEREAYRAGDRGGEFYVGIENVYPSKVAANRDVPIEEWTWLSGVCILTVWFHRVDGVWVAFDDIYRNEEIAF